MLIFYLYAVKTGRADLPPQGRAISGSVVGQSGAPAISRSVAFTTGAPPAGTPIVLVNSFTVIEYRPPGDTVSRCYAPRLNITNEVPVGIDATQFTFDLPGAGGLTEGACSPVHLDPGASADVFLESMGNWEGAFWSAARASAGEATGELDLSIDGSVIAVDLQGAAVPGQPPVTNTDRQNDWYAYCP